MRRLWRLCSKPPCSFIKPVEHGFAFVAERRMAEVMRQGNRFGQVFIELQRAGDVPRNRGDFHGVRQARAQMIAGAVEKNLGFVFEPAEGARMDDAVAVALVLGAPFGRRFLVLSPARIGAELRVGRQDLALDFFQFSSRARHTLRSEKPPEARPPNHMFLKRRLRSRDSFSTSADVAAFADDSAHDRPLA